MKKMIVVIEIIKYKGKGYLSFFSPFGIMIGRKRYIKLLKSLLKDFEFIYGEIFSGSMFNGVNKQKPISFTIWKYNKNSNTHIKDLSFMHNSKVYTLFSPPLLKDGWNYNEGKDGEEIGTSRNDTFNNPNPKMIKVKLHNAGSQMIQRNVKTELNIENIPDTLIYGLWSLCVGHRSLSSYPLIFSDCYTHLPDFNNQKAIEILSCVLLSSLITEIKNNNCDGKIGFFGTNRVFKFGGKELTEGALFLIKNCNAILIRKDYTIGSIFELLRKGEDPDEIDKKLRILIKYEIEKRLDEIGYWNYLPIPDVF